MPSPISPRAGRATEKIALVPWGTLHPSTFLAIPWPRPFRTWGWPRFCAANTVNATEGGGYEHFGARRIGPIWTVADLDRSSATASGPIGPAGSPY